MNGYRLTECPLLLYSVKKSWLLWYLIVIFQCGLPKNTKISDSVKKSGGFFDRIGQNRVLWQSGPQNMAVYP